MFPISTPKSNSRESLRVIKIKSPKSDIKLHKLNLIDSPKVSPELTARGKQTSNDDLDKVTQAWNRLKITALSKAIAMAPDVGPCTVGPKAPPLVEDECNKSDLGGGDGSSINLENVVTSTPVKHRQLRVTDKSDKTKDEADTDSSDPEDVNEDRKMSYIELLRLQCLEKIEAQIMRCAQRKRDQALRAWLENEEKIKVKLEALKIELDKECFIRNQGLVSESQKMISEAKENAELEAQQLQQSKFDHEKRVAETRENIKQIEQRRKELEEKQKLKREELKNCINGIYKMQVFYSRKYNQISEITKKCRDTRALNEKVTGELTKLKDMNETLLKIVDKSKEGKVTTEDLKTAEKLVQQICEICDIFSNHTDQINKSLDKAEEEKKQEELAKELRAKQEEADRMQKAKEESKKVEIQKTKTTSAAVKLSSGLEDCVKGEDLSFYLELSKNLDDFEKKLEPLLSNDSLKQFRFECQKVVNVPVNAISPLDDLHLEDKFYKLSRLLQGQAVPLGSSLFFATGHHLGIPFCTNLLAKKFVKQGEHTVSSKPEAAFAIAAVIVALWADYPEFGSLLLAHFHRECPYLIPAFLPQVEGQSNQDYYKMRGYQFSEDGKVEDQDKFLRRMSGVMRLYAAILITPLKRSQLAEGKKHPHGIREAWRWFTATLNLSPRPDISATLIFDFLEVTGQKLYKTYGLQFSKLLHLLCAEYYPLIEKVTPKDGHGGGPIVRLKSFLEKILKEGDVPAPTGLLPPSFW